MYDLANLDQMVQQKPSAHQREIMSFDWHPRESNKVVTGSLDKMVKIWDTNSFDLPLIQMKN